MPLKWEPGRNPYVFNCFGKLRIGSRASVPEICAQARQINQRLAVGETIELAGVPLDEHTINEASAALREPSSLAEELLLVHAQPTAGDRRRQKKLIESIRAQALREAEVSRVPPPLRSPAALLWFVPPPGPEAADPPAWEELGLVNATDPEDQEHDIVFDL
jgi:hypothetical protein